MTLTTIDRDPAVTASHTAHTSPLDRLGVDVTGSADTNTVLTDAKLANWNIHLRPLQTVPVPERHTMSLEHGVGLAPAEPAIAAPGAFATVRTSPHTGELEVIGTVGSKYAVNQNEDIVGFLDALVGASGGQLTKAADFYGNGKQVFFTIDLPTSVLVGGRDLVDHALTIFTSHNGSMAITPVISAIRPMCANMKNLLVASSAAFTRIRHSGDLAMKIEKARAAMEITFKQIETFDAQAEQMVNAELTDDTFWQIVSTLWKPEDNPSARAQTFTEMRESALTKILHGPTNANIDGTAWAGFNTITEYLQHNKDNASTARRAMSATGAMADLTDRALELFLTV